MTISWGILGAGRIAELQMAPAIAAAPGHELAAVTRRDLAAAEQFAADHGAQRAYDSEQALLADPHVNAVYVATPPHLHARLTILAAQAGKHILCEKPMALNSDEARRMIEACRANGVTLTICHYQRFKRAPPAHQGSPGCGRDRAGHHGAHQFLRTVSAAAGGLAPQTRHQRRRLNHGPGHPLHRPAALSVRPGRRGRGPGGHVGRRLSRRGHGHAALASDRWRAGRLTSHWTTANHEPESASTAWKSAARRAPLSPPRFRPKIRPVRSR